MVCTQQFKLGECNMKRKIAFVIMAVLMLDFLKLTNVVFATSAKENTFYELGEAASLEQTIDNPMDNTEIKPEEGYQNVHFTNKKQLKSSALQSCGKNVSWSLTDGVLTITGSGEMETYTSSSTAPWYSQSSYITSVVIEEGVTTIGDLAFYNCKNIVTVSIPETVSSIGKCAFAECSRLTEVILPNSVKELSYAVFGNCTCMTNIQCDGVTSIADYAFQGVPLDKFTVPAGLTSLASTAFFKAPIKEFAVAAGNEIYTEEDGILYTDEKKTLCVYPAGKTDTFFQVPSHVTKIGSLAMAYTSNLTSISFGNSVQTLEDSAFQNAGLVSLSIPDSVTTVGYFTFYGCPNLTSVTFGAGLKETSYQMFEGCAKLKEIDFGTVLNTIYSQTFSYCTALTNVALPETIQSLGTGCFAECWQLTDFSSTAISQVPYSTFWNCYQLQNVTLNEGVTTVYRCAFFNCNKLSAITLPESVTYVHSIAFPKNTVITCKNTKLQRYGQNGYCCLQQVHIAGNRNYTKAYEVLELVNEKRKQNGLHALYMNETLMESAMVRASEIAVCFSHTRPDSSSCFDLDSDMCAENIALGDQTAQNVMDSWMNSEGHKQNILLENATTIGIGCFVHNGVLYWTQCFGTGSDTINCSKPSDTEVTQQIALATEKFGEASTGVGVEFSFGEKIEYTYKFHLQLQKNSIEKGTTTKAKLCVTNPGSYSVSAVLEPDGITFESSNTSVAQVDSTGTVTGNAKGSATIKGILTYYNANSTLKVTDQTTANNTLSENKISEIKRQLPKGTVQSVKKINKNTLQVTCKKSSKVTGYQVRLAKNKKMTNAKTSTAKKQQITFKKLKAKQTYYIQVRVYKTVSGKKIYGNWGTVKKVKM